MLKTLSVAILCLIIFKARAQTSNAPLIVQSPSSSFKESQPYGKVDMEDLELKKCEFEPDANAEVLFDVGNVTEYSFERHIRLKIFNDFGKNAGNVRMEDNDWGHSEIQGETINLVNGKIEITPLDKKSIYREKINRFRYYFAFAFPNVKSGSIIEFKIIGKFAGIWEFQSNFPTRYSEIKTDFPGGRRFKFIPHVKQEFVKNIGAANDFTQIKALARIHSLPNEVFMSSRQSNLQRIEYMGVINNYGTWPKIADLLLTFFNWDDDINGTIKGEKNIINQAKSLKSDDEKIALIFDTVKNKLKWNNITSVIPENGTGKVWNDGIGNSGEINWALYHLLKKIGYKPHPLIVSTKENGKLNPVLPDFNKIASIIVYLPLDSNKIYFLDATNKFNLFNKIPAEQLNTFGLDLDQDTKVYNTFFLEDKEPAIQSIFINAEIQTAGKIRGTAEINSFSYQKTKALGKYDTLGKEKFIKAVALNDNNIKITDFKLEGADVDSIPLTQKFNFETELTGSDEKYIILNTDIFSFMGPNPFIKEERFTDIDFGYRENYALNSIYKIPPGFKTDSLPKSLTILTPDEGIVFKRTVAEDNGMILIKYSLNHRKTIYFREEYPDIKSFYKKIYELTGEQIVLKKIN